ncbi:MAG: organomercurial lyase MerB [Bradyrhizobiaceae bacterium]|nr:organomercurial lyase MerB [Bradyrhizobiaceae bacterium]
MSTKLTPANLGDRLVASVTQAGSPRSSPELYRTLLRLLARGVPVTIAQLATTTGRSVDDVQRTVSGWSDTEYDHNGRIIGWGLTLRPTIHKFGLDGKQLYTWCALDTLFFPAVIGRTARIESPCTATDIPVRIVVDPVAGVTALDPAGAVVSIVTPERMDSIRAAFCNPGRFFASREAAGNWQANHPGMEVLSVIEAYWASRSLSQALLEHS